MRNVLIIGGGRRGKGLLEILSQERDIKIVGIVDINENAEGIRFAKKLDISTYTDYKKAFENEVDAVFDVTGDPSVLNNVEKVKDKHTEVVGGLIAELISTILLERYEAHNIISTQKKEIESILLGIGEGVIIIDKNKKIFLINPVCKRLLGIKDEEMLSKKEHSSIIEVMERASRAEGELFITEEVEYRKKLNIGEVVKVFNIVASRINDENENLFAVAAVIRDITEEKSINKLKNEIIANVSHELRTPLTSIVNSIYLLEMDGLSQKQTKFIDIIKRNTQRLLRVINNLLDISRIESGMLSLKMEVVNIPHLIEDSISIVKGTLISKKIELKIDIEPHFPEVYGDVEGIVHILTNLISNAIKFTEEGGRITISCKSKDDDVYISVEDTGIGIPSSFLDKIFNKFQRATTADKIEGTGLGLVIVKHFVNMHHGRIHVESELGKGTKFTVSIPKIEKYFHIFLEEEIFNAKREEAYFSIVLLKLTNYQEIKSESEKWKILSDIEERIKGEIHKSDRVIRYKDKGFFIVLLHTGKEEAEKVGNRVREFVGSDLFKDVSQKIYVTYGIVSFPGDGEDKESLLEKLGVSFLEE